MNQAITVELHFFLISVLWGSIILFAYDGLRILRRLIKHGTIFLAAEDIIFWVAASLFIFSMIYKQNNGIIRGFSVMGMSLGMVIYHFLMKDYLVNFIAECIRTLLRPFALAVKTVKKFIHFLLLKGKKIVKFLTGRLKKATKSVKISVQKKNQALTAKRQLRRQKKAAVKNSKRKAAESKRNSKKAGRTAQADKPGQTAVPARADRAVPAMKFERVNINPQTRRYEPAAQESKTEQKAMASRKKSH